MTFGAPEWFWALLIIPFLIFLFVRAERRSVLRLQEFVSPRLLPQLTGTVNRFRRALRFTLLLFAVASAVVSLAQPRWGYVYQDVKRKGLDLILAVDTSRSMLSTDVQPNRLQRVKLAVQDLVSELQGDRIGMIAFAGRAFLQAPLTIDYDAAMEAINDLDTATIPEGGSNISEAIALAVQTYGKSAIGNRALIIFTDGEELSGDAIKAAKTAADAGVRIFTVGVGTPEGSLIPIRGEDGGTVFVKDSKGQVVKSKLDEKRLGEIAQATGGLFLRLEHNQRTMQQLLTEGLGKMQAGDIDARLSRRPIERYQWPLGVAILALSAFLLVNERKRERRFRAVPRKEETALAAAALVFLSTQLADGAAPGLEAYRKEDFKEAYEQFQHTLKEHPKTRVADKIEFDSGAAAYKMNDYAKALDSFSKALLSSDSGLQAKSHYNLGNTLYQRGETEKNDDKKLADWTNALQHYDQTLKIDPQNKEAKDNSEFVKKKIEELKRKQEQQPSPTPSPSPKPQQNQKQEQSQEQKEKQQQQQDQSQEQKEKQQQQQSSSQGQDQQQQKQDKSGNQKQESGSNQEQKDGPDGSQKQKEPEQSDKEKKEGSGPSPSPADENNKMAQNRTGDEPPQSSPTPGEKDQQAPSLSPTPGEGMNSDPGENPSSSPTPAASPERKLSGEVKGAAEEKSDKMDEVPEVEQEREGELSAKQAESLLQSMKDEEQRVQLDERRPARRVYNDW